MPLSAPPRLLQTLGESEWKARAEAHRQRLEPRLTERHRRRRAGEAHPVEDFLFDYYPYPPQKLLRWHPGHGVALEGEAAIFEYGAMRGYRIEDGCVSADPGALKAERWPFIEWLRALLVATRDRAPKFACHGMHEWAMVYRAEAVRHEKWPLRQTPAEIARVVESAGLACTHYDAYRFFTSEAAPLNRTGLARDESLANEQRGCLHVNMDLYKWAFKLAPFTPSELVADAFDLAWKIRELDMRASPYDFRALGFEPVRIETEEGKAEYVARQRGFAAEGELVRARLLRMVEGLLGVKG